MRVVKIIVGLAVVGVVFLLGFAVVVRPSMQEVSRPGLAGILICLGVILIGTGTAFQIARTSKRRRVASAFIAFIKQTGLMAVCDPLMWFYVFILLRSLSGHS
jgi:hypothetical protein